MEYWRRVDDANASALSRLPAGLDDKFDREEQGVDVCTVCAVRVKSTVKPNKTWTSGERIPKGSGYCNRHAVCEGGMATLEDLLTVEKGPSFTVDTCTLRAFRDATDEAISTLGGILATHTWR